MASSRKPVTKTLLANGAIHPNSFVKLDTTSPATGKDPHVIQCGANDSPYGIAQSDSTSDFAQGDEVEVARLGGGAKLKLGGTVTAGQSLKSDASGYGIAATTAGDRIGAQAEQSGVSGDVVGADVQRFEKNNSDAT